MFTLSIKMLDVGSASIVAMKTVKVTGGLEQVVDAIPDQTCLLLKEALSKDR